MGDPHGGPQTSPQHADPRGLGAFVKRTTQEMHVDRRVVGMWITHVGGKFRHGLLEKSLNNIMDKIHLSHNNSWKIDSRRNLALFLLHLDFGSERT